MPPILAFHGQITCEYVIPQRLCVIKPMRSAKCYLWQNTYSYPLYKITLYQREKRPGLSFGGTANVYPAFRSLSQGMVPVPRQLSVAGNQIAQSYRKQSLTDTGPVTPSLVRVLGEDSLLNPLVIKLVKWPYDAGKLFSDEFTWIYCPGAKRPVIGREGSIHNDDAFYLGYSNVSNSLGRRSQLASQHLQSRN